ncbi:hypothetical protein ACHAQH_002549 [Verticillium albo-atrum]
MSQTPDEALRDAMKRLRKSGEYYDMTIVCGDQTYRAHKAIVCSRSKYLEAMFKSGMQEEQTSEVDLSEHNPQAVKLLVDFFYDLDYTPSHSVAGQAKEPELEETTPKFIGPYDEHEQLSPGAETTTGSDGFPTVDQKKKKMCKEQRLRRRRELKARVSTSAYANSELNPGELAQALHGKTFLLEHCHVYALAEYFQVDELKTLAASKFLTEAEKHWNHPDFFEAIQEVYRTSARNDRILRGMVVDVLYKHKELLGHHEYQVVISQLDLSFELLMAVHRGGGWAAR